MDVAYKQHSSHARRKNRSSSNLNHLSLAPLTTKMPLTDAEHLPDFVASPLHHNPSYLQGKSAPTTPRLFQSPSQTRANSPRRRASITDAHGAANSLAKSKSTTHLHVYKDGRHVLSGFSPLSRRRHDEDQRRDSDWMLRAGALISSETRESKGQAWLISRASSTSLTGVRDAEEEAYERELARERELASRRNSRRGSAVGIDDEFVPSGSRYGSRSQSRMGSRSRIVTPLERSLQDGYFGQDYAEDNIPGPDFVSLDEELEAVEFDTSNADEATIRKLITRRGNGVGAWMWSLFAVEENDEDSDTADGDLTDGETESQAPRSASTIDFEGFSTPPEPRVPPPKGEEGTGWQDAAWLLSVASKVLL
ncbi:hypothetical protein F5B22DRAFT_278746 [Xylaria bambusicola]|uniref:uncharacterized protein n=1 Tax=Xylaria bambusicola TaxID=326684 RepID=UPI002008D097|nr:uncharacterized protein F5B22DRAFT_278746 [Xylaria bambusicola]KAI0513209.1 hypothetical protein F5B22DRAFT_278746 [Xylaria bambusicola]